MTLSSVRAGDIVLCNVKGRVFHAVVTEKIDGVLKVRPIEPNITYYSVGARQVTGHWIKSRRRAAVPA